MMRNESGYRFCRGSAGRKRYGLGFDQCIVRIDKTHLHAGPAVRETHSAFTTPSLRAGEPPISRLVAIEPDGLIIHREFGEILQRYVDSSQHRTLIQGPLLQFNFTRIVAKLAASMRSDLRACRKIGGAANPVRWSESQHANLKIVSKIFSCMRSCFHA